MGNKKYRPSNGTEGLVFIEHYCANCIHGKYEHTGDTNDNPCEILTRSFMCGIDDKDYVMPFLFDELEIPKIQKQTQLQ